MAGVAACGSSAVSWDDPHPDTYVVRRGDTLYGIAWRYGVDHRDLAAWNQLGSGSFIRPGQSIRLSRPTAAGRSTASSGTQKPPALEQAVTPDARAAPPAVDSQPRVAPPKWSWPVSGRIVSEFRSENGLRTGALLEGKRLDPIYAAADGKVVYSGSGLIGYGRLIIIKHNEAFLSAYGHNEELLVAEGDRILRGQLIARMGEGPGRVPRLHFEIRHNGHPVNPRQFLPPH